MYIRPPSRSIAIRPIVLLPLIILFGMIISGCTLADTDSGGVSSSSVSSSSSAASSSPAPLALYFGSTTFNPNTQICDAVFAVTRENIDADATPEELLELLFAGPTAEEQEEGYMSFLSDETADAVRSVRVWNRTAYVDLIDIRGTIPNASTSCGSAQFMAEIQETLMQYPDIDRVILAIEGDPEPIYEWLQIGCTAENDNCDTGPFGGTGGGIG